jgi:DNA polymerase elongation subunit (family B)
MRKRNLKGPRVLLLDIETAPMLGYVWGLFDQNVSLNMIHSDWHVLSWAAKWLGEKKIMYMDQRKAKAIEDDSTILKGVWTLLDEADIVITQNGISFDVKKLKARFVLHNIKPPSSFRHIDTLRIARKHFAFTSNKLEYLSHKLNTKYKKLKHKKFEGFELWKECLAGNQAAWKEMEKYNKYDVLALEEVYYKLIPWDGSIDFNVYNDSTDTVCKCGSSNFEKRGFSFTNVGKFQRYQCRACGSWTHSKINLLSKEKRQSLRPGGK